MRRPLLIALLLVLALRTAGAVRVLEQVETAVELTLGELGLPSGPGGSLRLRACPRCDISNHRLSAATVFNANGRSVAFAELARLAAELRHEPNGASGVAVVFLDTASGRVTRIEIRK